MIARPDAAGTGRPTAIIVMGVAGSGKTTIAERLATRLGWVHAEADDFHPPDNIAKMAAGVPLTDADRQPWLDSLRDWITERQQDVVVTCSALRRQYRDTLRGADATVKFIHLHGDPDLLAARIGARADHFMPASLLHSQLATLEPLGSDEDGVVIDVSAPLDAILDTAYEYIGSQPGMKPAKDENACD